MNDILLRKDAVVVNFDMLGVMLEPYKFTARRYVEDSGSITLSLDEIDLAVNARDDEEAIRKMAEDILEYSEDYFHRFDSWYSSANRKPHLPYVFKALMLNDAEQIKNLITCRHRET